VRILSVGNMYPPHHLGGYELVWASATAYQRESGHEVRVLASDHREAGKEDSREEGVFRELRWYWDDHRFPRLGVVARGLLERHNQAVLRRHLREFMPDVVAWWAMGGMSMALIERVRCQGLPSVAFVHDEWLLYGPLVDQWQRAVARLGTAGVLVSRGLGIGRPPDFAQAGQWVFVSDTVRRHALAAHPDLSSAVAPSGIDLDAFDLAPAKPWGWRLLCAGRLDERKGVHVAVEALSHMPQATLMIAGSGDAAYESRIKARVGELGLEPRVTFESLDRADLALAYARADAVLFPVQWEEPWGLVPLEAMAVGTPVVASGAGGSSEFLRDGENCLIYKPRDDPSELASCVRRLEAHAELLARLRSEGRATAVRHTQARFNHAALVHLEEAVS